MIENRELAAKIAEILGPSVDVELVPIPATQDRMVRLRTLQEILEHFDEIESAATEGATGYLIQLRPLRKSSQTTSMAAALNAPEATQSAASGTNRAIDSSIYVSQGKLNAPFLLANAATLVAAGDYALARNIYKALLMNGEQSATALFGIANCFEHEGKINEAIEHFEEAIAYHPTLESYRRLAALLSKQGKDQQAVEVLERALNIKDLGSRERFNLHIACGNGWSKARAIEKAEAHFKAAAEIDPSADSVPASLGAIKLQAGDILDARAEFESALAKNPKNDSALMGLGSCWLAIGDKRAAHDCFSASLEANLNNPTAIYHLVKCAYELKSYATAARLVEEYIEIAPVNVNLLYSLAGLQFHLGRHSDAQATASKILEVQPTHSGANDLLRLIPS